MDIETSELRGLLELARTVKTMKRLPSIHLVFSVQEEFNLRGAVTAAQRSQRRADRNFLCAAGGPRRRLHRYGFSGA